MRHILFDFDGTIANSMPVQDRLLGELAKERGQSLSVADFRNRDNLSPLRKAKLGAFMLKIAGEYKSRYAAAIGAGEVQPFPGMLPLLEELQGLGAVVGIVSSNEPEAIRRFFATQAQGMDIPVWPSEGFFGKAKTFRGYMEGQQASTEELLYVGDERRDAEAASSAGIGMVYVTWGLDGPAGAASKGVTATASSVEELTTLLKDWIQK
ncbi:MAG: HAD family hydrolase [Oscillospiraceae bacterium]